MKAIVSTILLVLVFGLQDVLAQGCAMCTATASNLDGKAATGLNYGIIYLGMIPFLLIGFIAYKWYKNQKATDSENL